MVLRSNRLSIVRGLAAAASKAKELGIQKVIISRVGNAGGAMAVYAARAGLKAHIYMPKDRPLANIEESRMAGGGTGLVGMWKALAELEALGWLNHRKRQRMVAGRAGVTLWWVKGAVLRQAWQGKASFQPKLRLV